MTSDSNHSATLFLADNLALDFINSAYGVAEQQHDCFTDDRSVIAWLTTAGVLSDEVAPPRRLLALACELREESRALVKAAMNGTASDATLINSVLEAGRPQQKLAWHDETQQFYLRACADHSKPAGLLWPIADALVTLVTSEKFEFVRQCEAHDCILLFHDLSKSHRRRWCSMATCGNRMKVAAFRSRKSQ